MGRGLRWADAREGPCIRREVAVRDPDELILHLVDSGDQGRDLELAIDLFKLELDLGALIGDGALNGLARDGYESVSSVKHQWPGEEGALRGFGEVVEIRIGQELIHYSPKLLLSRLCGISISGEVEMFSVID